MNTEFKRENRYIVIKHSDLDKLHPSYNGKFSLELNCISAQMPSRKCLVIESDWPEYEPAWAAIEARVTGKPVEQHQGEPIGRLMRDKHQNIVIVPIGDPHIKDGMLVYTHADPGEIEALRGAYLRAGELEHELRTELAKLRAALKFYADRDHYSTDDGSSWDSCSGEPANILWHESEPWFIEDGSIARAALERKASDDIPDFTPGKGNRAERRATQLLAQLQANLTARDEQIDALSMDASRYRWLRSRDLETISQGGVFAGLTPDNLVLNEETLDQAIDAAMAPDYAEASTHGRLNGVPAGPCAGCGTPGYTGNCDKCIPY